MATNFDNLRSLAWKQPYGTLMLLDKIETRNRPTKVRGDVLIYTSLKAYEHYTIRAISGPKNQERIELLQKRIRDNTWDLYGFAIAIGTLIDCWQMRPTDDHLTFVEYDHQRWCWGFSNVRRIEPFKYEIWSDEKKKMVSAGGQGWGFVPEELKSKIRFI